MKKGWTTTKLIAVGSLGALRVILATSGATIISLTGIPGTGGLNGVIAAFFFALTCLLVPNFGAATLMSTLFTILALPLPVSGAPGFLPKVFIGFSTGLTADLTFQFFREKLRLASIISGLTTSPLIFFEILLLGYLFEIPGIEKTMRLAKSPLLIFILLGGGFGGWLGWIVYQKLKNTAVVKRIQQV